MYYRYLRYVESTKIYVIIVFFNCFQRIIQRYLQFTEKRRGQAKYPRYSPGKVRSLPRNVFDFGASKDGCLVLCGDMLKSSHQTHRSRIYKLMRHDDDQFVFGRKVGHETWNLMT